MTEKCGHCDEKEAKFECIDGDYWCSPKCYKEAWNVTNTTAEQALLCSDCGSVITNCKQCNQLLNDKILCDKEADNHYCSDKCFIKHDLKEITEESK